MRFVYQVLILLVASTAVGAPPSVKLPAEVKGLPGAWIVIPAEVEGGKPKWRLSAGIEEVRLDVLFPAELLDKAKGKVVVANKPGRYVVEAWNAAGDEASDIATAVVIVGNPPPVPPKPDDEDDTDPPVPPIPATGFRVLFVYETASNLTREQLNILHSTTIRGYLREKCAKSSAGVPEFRYWDINIGDGDQLKRESETWQKIWAATKPSLPKLPAVVIINDTKGEAFELPATEQATLDLLKRYGG